MKIANIYPIANQLLYRDESYVMILAHLVKDGKYRKKNFNDAGQYIIMDNGLFEKAQVSTSLLDCIRIAEDSGIRVNEIIIPDAVNDSARTIELFLENLETILDYQNEYKFMFVAQANYEHELEQMINFINRYNLNLSVGISKLCPFNRASEEAIRIYKKCKYPIHILGIKESFAELDALADVKQIRGCDTSQLAFMDKNKVIDDVHDYIRDGEDIDLDKDVCSNTNLIRLKLDEQERLKDHGIL